MLGYPLERSLLAVYVDEVSGDVGGPHPESEPYGFGGEPAPGDAEGLAGGVNRLVVAEGLADGFVADVGVGGGTGLHSEPPEPVVHAGAGHAGGGGEFVDRFACSVPADQLFVGQTHPVILPSGSVSGMDIDDLEALESEVLAALEAADDADAPPGTLPLSAARRRRSVAETAKFLDAG
jgi:hypothetical protein